MVENSLISCYFFQHKKVFILNNLMAKIRDLENKTILITGGTGFLGQKLAKKLLELDTPKKIIILSRDEFKQHEMRQGISDPKGKLIPCLISCCLNSSLLKIIILL